MPWERHQYRSNKVWVEIDDAGAPALDDRGLASLRYKPGDSRTYSVRAEDLGPVEAEARPEEAEAGEGIHVTTAGAAAAEPGPAGIGVVLRWRDHGREIQRFLDPTTALGARLAAVLAALRAVTRPGLPVTIHADAAEAQAICTGSGAPDGAPPELAEALRAEAARFETLRWAPTPEGEPSGDAARAARLAQDAVEAGG